MQGGFEMAGVRWHGGDGAGETVWGERGCMRGCAQDGVGEMVQVRWHRVGEGACEASLRWHGAGEGAHEAGSRQPKTVWGRQCRVGEGERQWGQGRRQVTYH